MYKGEGEARRGEHGLGKRLSSEARLSNCSTCGHVCIAAVNVVVVVVAAVAVRYVGNDFCTAATN